MSDHFHDQLFGDEAMYREEILEHNRNPHNAGTLQDATFSHRESNTSCGDLIEMYVRLDAGRVADVRFEGKGCAISQAACSMLTDAMKGKTLPEIAAMRDEDIFALLGFRVGMTRIRCALLGLRTVQEGIAEYRKETTGATKI